MRRRSHAIVAIALSLAAAYPYLSGCSGGGGSTTAGASYPAKILRWTTPAQFTDNTPLNPATDLDVFEIYIKTNAVFTVNDTPMAAVHAYDPGTGQITTNFNLTELAPFLSRGVLYYVSIRAIAKNGMWSDFSQPASFSF